MIFYRATDVDGLVHWVTSQDEAKGIEKSFTKQEIGNSQADLKELLNECEAKLHDQRQTINRLIFEATITAITVDQPSEVEPAQPSPPPKVAVKVIVEPKSIDIVDWLLNTATQSQVENVFSAIGCRWGEACK